MRKSIVSVLLRSTLLLALPVVLTSCVDELEEILGQISNPTPEPVVSVTSIKLNKTTASLTVGGDKEALTVTVSPADATDKSVTWSSDKEVVASVDKNGVVTAVTLGTATITATANDGSGAKATFAVTVYGHPADAEVVNAATYNVLNALGGSEAGGILNNPFYWWELMSDNCYGSGSLKDKVAKSLHHLTMADANQCEQVFLLLYEGISRANNQIETIDYVDWEASQTDQRDQLLGEAYFMRGFYTLLLTQLFGDVPLITSTTITEEMQQQVSAEDVIFPQILSDFVSAKNLMGTDKSNAGRANKFVAEAYIGRAYMFWAGFYKRAGELATSDATINLVEQEGCHAGPHSKSEVVIFLKDIVSQGGYTLCEDYRSLWQYSNKLLWNEAKDTEGHAYNFIADMPHEKCFDQPGMGNGNTEAIFQIQFANSFSWNIPSGFYYQQRLYSNNMSVYWGLHKGATNNNGKRSNTYPFNQGLGQGTPSCNLWDDWTDTENNGGYTDIRKRGSMIDLDNELAAYTYESDDCEESGYAVKKYAGVSLDACAADNDSWWIKASGYTANSLVQGNNFENFYLMRYADVLLMLTELTGDAQYMNLVQARAGVPQTAYSLRQIKNERRWEFAFEGLRFNDMRRWSGWDFGNNSYGAYALQAQSGKLIVCRGDKDNKLPMAHMTCSWSERFVATKGFLPKPQAQITLMNGKLVQNPGWDTSDPNTQYRDIY